jgi:hypothetical protein
MYSVLEMVFNTHHISFSEFVEKYKLIPKQIRLGVIELLENQEIVRSVPDCWLRSESSVDIEKYIKEYKEYCVCLFDVLKEYEKIGVDYYNVLFTMLHEEVYAGHLSVYTDVSKTMLNIFKTKSINISLTDVCLFRKKQVMREILDVVAYRPYNLGYERAKEHFESMVEVYM